MTEPLPEEAVHYTHPTKLDDSQIDDPLIELINELNESEWCHTICSCSGHAESYDIFRTWNTTTMEIVMAIPQTEWETYLGWYTLVREPNINPVEMVEWVSEHEKEPLTEVDNWQLFLLSPGRGLRDVDYMEEEPEDWHVRKVKYDWSNVGQREHMIQLMRWAVEVTNDD